MKPAFSFFVVGLTAFCGAHSASAEVLQSYQRPIGVTMHDRIETDSKGNRYYITAHDGKARLLVPLLSKTGSSAAENYESTASYGSKENAESGVVNIPINSGLTILPPPPLFPTPRQSNGLPERVMLDELGLVTPVKDQGGRGSCTLFSAVGAIESQYLATYYTSLNLSEEYVINMMNENRSPDWVGGMPSEKLYVASYYGIAPTSDWAYNEDDGNNIFNTVAGVFGVSTSNSSAMSTLGNNVWNNALDRDIANYNTQIYPPIKAHQDAIYGPTPGSLAPVPLSGTNPAPIETLLSQHHAISFATAIGAWQQNASTGVFDWNPSGDQTTDHAVVLVGYDHVNQVFRIKNSWGAGWNGNGFAEISYELFFKTVQGPYYVTGLRNPLDHTQGGTGIWRGFWRADVNGNDGVAVLHHAFASSGNAYVNVESSDAGYFYANNGAVWPIEWLSGNSTSALVSINGQLTWLFMAGGAQSAVALTLDFFWFNIDKQWTRCVQGAAGNDLDPTGYLATAGDPYLFAALAGCPR